jgi:hypothetical protein
MIGETDPVEEIASGVWMRLRNLIGALDRVDRLETSTDYVGWLQDLSRDQAGLDETIANFVSRALRIGLDPVNWRILTSLEDSGAVPTSVLQKMTSLSRVELVERMNELARAGLTAQTVDGDQVEATRFARGLHLLMDELTAQVRTLALNDYLIKGPARSGRLTAESAAVTDASATS